MPRLKRIIVSLLLISAVAPFTISQESNTQGKEESMADLSNEQLADEIAKSAWRAIKVANEKAVELGYNLRELTLVIIQKNTMWEVYYKPIEEKKRGGDLKIVINSKGSVEMIERGQ